MVRFAGSEDFAARCNHPGILDRGLALRATTSNDIAISPGPHSAMPMPGTFRFSSTLASAYLSSSLTPSSSSPFGLRGQGSAFSSYSCSETPQICDAVGTP